MTSRASHCVACIPFVTEFLFLEIEIYVYIVLSLLLSPGPHLL
jgi:hypothetical protein